MYLKSTRRWYEANGTQHTGRQWFLLLVQPGTPHTSLSGYMSYTPIMNDDKPRGIVRKVALEQLGHWMMGYARAFGYSIVCSGDYGADGLVKTVAQEVYDKAVPLSDDVYQTWAKDSTGHNCAGVSGKVVRQWALDNFGKLAPKGARLSD